MIGGALALVAGCAPPEPRTPGRREATLPDRVRVRTTAGIVSVPLEEYVLASALSEVVPLNESAATVARIYEVQAVLARTYATFSLGRHRASGFDLCDTAHCQLYQPDRIRTSRFSAVASEAVRRTAGLVLIYDARPLEALFHSDCGGYTASAESVWGGAAVPYLLPRPDDVPRVTHHKWLLPVPAERLRAALNADARSQIGRRLDGMEIQARDVSGRASRIEIAGEHDVTLRGEELRAILNRALGDSAVLSTRFKVSRSKTTYVFEGSGFGHGVGLCQAGALAHARRGDSLQTILGSYFPGSRLSR